MSDAFRGKVGGLIITNKSCRTQNFTFDWLRNSRIALSLIYSIFLCEEWAYRSLHSAEWILAIVIIRTCEMVTRAPNRLHRRFGCLMPDKDIRDCFSSSKRSNSFRRNDCFHSEKNWAKFNFPALSYAILSMRFENRTDKIIFQNDLLFLLLFILFFYKRKNIFL